MHLLRRSLFLGKERLGTARDDLCCGTGLERLIEEKWHLMLLKHRDLQFK